MGVQATFTRPFYEFRPEEQVPIDHVLKGVDRHIGEPLFSNAAGAL